MLDRVTLKQQAKAAMRGRTPAVYLVALVLALIFYVLEMLNSRLQLPGLTQELMMEVYTTGMTEEMADRILNTEPGAFAEILTAAIWVMRLMLTMGFISYCLNVSRGHEAGFGSLFDGFTYFFKLLWLNVLIGIFVFLWSLLLIVPGIVASYRYSMAVYFLWDDPSRSAMDCIRLSKELTQGHKGQLFVLDLSFLGWFLISGIPFVGAYVMPYYRLTHIRYYQTLTGETPAA